MLYRSAYTFDFIRVFSAPPPPVLRLALCLYPLLVFRPYVGPSAEQTMGLIVPVNNNIVPSGLGLRHERMFVSFFLCFVLLQSRCVCACLFFESGVHIDTMDTSLQYVVLFDCK